MVGTHCGMRRHFVYSCYLGNWLPGAQEMFSKAQNGTGRFAHSGTARGSEETDHETFQGQPTGRSITILQGAEKGIRILSIIAIIVIYMQIRARQGPIKLIKLFQYN